MVILGIRSFGSNPLIYGKYCLIYSLQYSFHRSISTNPPTHLCIKPRYDLSRQRTIMCKAHPIISSKHAPPI